MKKVRSSHPCTELNKIQFFPVTIVKGEFFIWLKFLLRVVFRRKSMNESEVARFIGTFGSFCQTAVSLIVKFCLEIIKHELWSFRGWVVLSLILRFLYCPRSFLTFSWRRSLSYRNQFIDLQGKSVDWFLYDRDLRHERVKKLSGTKGKQKNCECRKKSMQTPFSHQPYLCMNLWNLEGAAFRRFSSKYVFLNILQYSLENTCVGVGFFIKKRLQHRCFPVNIVKFLRTPILKNSANGFFPIRIDSWLYMRF